MRAPDTPGGPAIEVERLVKRFGQVEAVNDISFAVGRGEIFGFLGPNGAGKSTTIKILATLTKPTGGRAVLNGFDVAREPTQVRRSIGLVFQDNSLDDRLTAMENLYFHALMYGVGRAEFAVRSQALLRMVDLDGRKNDVVRTFSGGMRRRLEIARGLMHRPAVLFLDEPTVGLDPQTRSAIWGHVRRLRDEHGVTVFMTTHYMDEADNCDRIAVIDHGRIVAIGTPEELRRQVGREAVLVGTADAAALAAEVARRYGVQADVTSRPGELRIEVDDAAAFLPRLAADFAGRVDSLRVHRPTLDDVFLHLTGREIREEEQGALEQMRMFMGRRRR